MAVGNMHQRGYSSHGMTGRHDSVTSICPASVACHVYISSCHKSDDLPHASVFIRQDVGEKLTMYFAWS